MKAKTCKCKICGREMAYGETDIHSCVSRCGIQVDLCSDCWSKYTKDTKKIANLITKGMK